MFEHILDCPRCKKRFHYEYDGGTYPPLIHCPECGEDSPYEEYSALILCNECRVKIKVPLSILHDEGNACPKCGALIQADHLGLQEADTYTLAEGVVRQGQGRMLEDGAFFDKFRIIKLLGKGGMAEVYLAEHLLLKQTCALKLMQKTLDQENDPVFIKRFIREAKLTHSLNHPNIVRVFDAGSDFKTGYLFLAMEYVEGFTLHEIINNGVLSEESLLEILKSIAGALKSLEAAKVVHRDIKPSNIMYTNDDVYKLMDLGIAKIESNHQMGDMTLTMEQSTIGTPGYASPEQCQSAHQTDIRSDIYSLGATLYHAASGMMPFTGDTPVAVILNMMQNEAVPLRNYRKDLSDDFIRLVEKMMRKKPSERFQNVDELLAAAERVVPGKSLPAPVRKVKNVVTAFATTFFSAKKETKKKGVLDKIASAGLKIFFSLLLVVVAAVHIYYVMVNRSASNVSYKDFMKGLLFPEKENPRQMQKLSKTVDLSVRLNKMHPMIVNTPAELRKRKIHRWGETPGPVTNYPEVIVSYEGFKKFTFDTVPDAGKNIFPDMLKDGVLDLDSDAARLLDKNPNLPVPGEPSRYGVPARYVRPSEYVTCFINFQVPDVKMAGLFNIAGLDVFILHGTLRMVWGDSVHPYYADTGIEITPERWMNLVIFRDLRENKITILSENHLLGTWVFARMGSWRADFNLCSFTLNSRMKGKIDFIALSAHKLKYDVPQAKSYSPLQVHTERLPDKLPEGKKSAFSQMAPSAPGAERQAAPVPAASVEKNIPEKTVVAPEKKSVHQAALPKAEKTEALFPVWRKNIRVGNFAGKKLSVDEHFAELQKSYAQYAVEVKELRDSVSKMPDSIPEDIRRARLAIVEKAEDLCKTKVQRLDYLKKRNLRIRNTKNKRYSVSMGRKWSQEITSYTHQLYRNMGYTHKDREFAEKLLGDLKSFKINPNLDVTDGRYPENSGSIFKLAVAGRFADPKKMIETLIQLYADPSGLDEIKYGMNVEKLGRYGLNGKGLQSYFAYWVRNTFVSKQRLDLLAILLADGAPPTGEHLSQAVLQKNEEMVLLLLAAGADPNATNAKGMTALMSAYMIPDGKRIRDLLLAGGADPAMVSGGKVAADFVYMGEFAAIFEKQDFAAIKKAFQFGIFSPDHRLYNNRSLLQDACFRDDEAMVKFLLENGASPNGGKERFTPVNLLFYKSEPGRLTYSPVSRDMAEKRSRIMLMLLKAGAGLRGVPLYYICSTFPNSESLIPQLVPYLDDMDFYGLRSLFSMSTYRREIISKRNKQLLIEGCSGKVLLQSLGHIMDTPFSEKAMQKMLDAGLNPDRIISVRHPQAGYYCRLPVWWHLIAFNQSPEVVELALKQGVDFNWKDQQGRPIEQALDMTREIRQLIRKYKNKR